MKANHKRPASTSCPVTVCGSIDQFCAHVGCVQLSERRLVWGAHHPAQRQPVGTAYPAYVTVAQYPTPVVWMVTTVYEAPTHPFRFRYDLTPLHEFQSLGVTLIQGLPARFCKPVSEVEVLAIASAQEDF